MLSIKRMLAAGLVVAGLAGCDGPSTNANSLADLVLVSGNGQFGLPNAALPESLVVRAVDGKGSGMAGIPITWNLVSGGGSVQPAATTTDGTGRLAARWMLANMDLNTVIGTDFHLARTPRSATAIRTSSIKN